MIVFNGVFSDTNVKSWFDKTVDQVFNEEKTLKNLITFLLNYALHAVPKDETYSSVKAGQLALYDDDPAKEIANGFPCFLEYMTRTDMSWCTWQYYNSIPDWITKKNNGATVRHTLKARFTGDKHCRRQPEEDSEGMKLYHTMTKWYEEFKSHDDFVTKARPLCNEIAKEMKLIPTWTAESGPKKSIKKRVDPDPDVEAPELDIFDEEIDDMCFQDAIAEGRSRFSHYNEPSVDDEENVE
jgi:hypothetical protein